MDDVGKDALPPCWDFFLVENDKVVGEKLGITFCCLMMMLLLFNFI